MKIDFSIMPSLRCNIHCSFCMYNSQLEETDILDFDKTASFISQWNWADINQVGFYGGEPSINLPMYQKFINLIPHETSKFIITNGTWSKDIRKTAEFMKFVADNNMYLIVSGTHEHRPHQNRTVLRLIEAGNPNAVRLKEEDVIHAMGRARGIIHPCDNFCQKDDRIMRLAIHPSGYIMYQNCHGDYPIVQSIDNPYEGIYERAKKTALECSRSIF